MNEEVIYKKIPWLKDAPRKLTPEIEAVCQKIKGKPLWFVFWGGGKKAWKDTMENMILSYVYVAQANQTLFNKEEAQWAPAVLLATADARSNDPKWVKQKAESVLKDSPAELERLISDEESHFDIQVPGTDFKAMTTYIDPERLPNGFIPKERVLPAVKCGEQWILLPNELYA